MGPVTRQLASRSLHKRRNKATWSNYKRLGVTVRAD